MMERVVGDSEEACERSVPTRLTSPAPAPTLSGRRANFWFSYLVLNTYQGTRGRFFFVILLYALSTMGDGAFDTC